MSRTSTLLALFVLAAGARFLYLGWADPEPEMAGLTRKYRACAQHLLEGHGWVLQERPEVPYVDRLPGYVTLLAGLEWLTGGNRLALQLAHALLAALAVFPLEAIGRRLRGRRAGAAAAALFALWPPFWKSDVQLLETGTCGLVLAALVWTSSDVGRRPSRGRLVGAALLSTAAVALRPDYLGIPIVVAVLLAWSLPRGERRRPIAAVLLLPIVLLVPWAARNAAVADGPFVSVGLGVNLLAALGESVTSDAPLFGDRDVARSEGHAGLYWPQPKTRDRERVRRALRLIAENPAGYLIGALRRIPVTLSLTAGELWPGGPTLRESVAAWREAHPGRPRYEGLFAATWGHFTRHPVRAVLTLAWGPLLLALAAWGGLRRVRPRRDLLALLLLPAYGLVVHLPLHAEPRYFFPFAGPLFVLAGLALTLAPEGDGETPG